MKLNIKEFFSKRKLLENLGLKVTALVFAVIIWIIVVNITDPMDTRKYSNVQVRLVNSYLVTDSGKTIRVLKNTDVIPSVVVRAPRSVIKELGNSSDSVSAIADFNNLSSDGTAVIIDFSTSKYSDKIDSIKGSFDKLQVEIENKKTIQLPIQVTTSGDIAGGYVLGKVTLGQNQVRISGPESVVSSVKKACVDVQLTGFTENISTLSDIVLYDADDEEVPTDELSMNSEYIRVDAEILATKKVPIYYATIGNPAEGYALTGEVDINPETVVIAGEDKDIAKVSLINIPASELNVTGQTSDLKAVLDITDYLPEGITLGDATYNGKVSFTVYIEQKVTDSFGVYLRNVEILNVPEGFEASWGSGDDNIEFTLEGLTQDLEKLSLSSLGYRVDFNEFALDNGITNFRETTYELPLILDLPDEITQAHEVKLPVKLKKISTNNEG